MKNRNFIGKQFHNKYNINYKYINKINDNYFEKWFGW